MQPRDCKNDNDNDNQIHSKDTHPSHSSAKQPSSPDNHIDVAVVGRGPAGLAAAYHLASAAISNGQRLNITLIESRKKELASIRTVKAVLRHENKLALLNMIRSNEVLHPDDIQLINSVLCETQVEVRKIQEFILRRIEFLNQLAKNGKAHLLFKSDLSNIPFTVLNRIENLDTELNSTKPEEKKCIISFLHLTHFINSKKVKNLHQIQCILIGFSENKKDLVIDLDKIKKLLNLDIKHEIQEEELSTLLNNKENQEKLMLYALAQSDKVPVFYVTPRSGEYDVLSIESDGVIKNQTIKKEDLEKLTTEEKESLRSYLNQPIKTREPLPILSKLIPQTNLVDFNYETELTNIDFELGTLLIKKNGSSEKKSFTHIIASDGAHSKTRKLLPEEEKIERTMPKEMDYLEGNYHMSAYIELSRQDEKDITIPENEFTTQLLSGFMYFMHFGKKSHEKSNDKKVNISFVGEIPKKVYDDIQNKTGDEKRKSFEDYVKQCAAKYLGVKETDLVCKVKLSKNKNNNIKNTKNKIRTLTFEGKNRQAAIAAKKINEHSFYLLGDAYFTPNYPVGHGLNDGLDAAQTFFDLYKNPDNHLSNYNEKTKQNANNAISNMRLVKYIKMLLPDYFVQRFFEQINCKVDIDLKNEHGGAYDATKEYITNTLQSKKFDSKKLQTLLYSTSILIQFKDLINTEIDKIDYKNQLIIRIKNKVDNYDDAISKLKALCQSANSMNAPTGVTEIINLLSFPPDVTIEKITKIIKDRLNVDNNTRDKKVVLFYKYLLQELTPYRTIQESIQITMQRIDATPSLNKDVLFPNNKWETLSPKDKSKDFLAPFAPNISLKNK